MSKQLSQLWKVLRGYFAFFITIFLIWWTVTTDFSPFMRLDIINARWFFVVVLASFFPITMAAYQIFQKETRYERFLIDIDLLGIPTNEAEKKFEREYGLANYLLQIIPTILFTVVGASILLNIPLEVEAITDSTPANPAHIKDVLGLVSDNAFVAMQYGFLGAYLFSFQLVYRRFTTLDMQPSVFMYCTMTIAAGLLLNLVAFQAISELANSSASPTGIGAGMLAILAFSIGYFPNMAIRWFNKLSNTTIGLNERRSTQLPLGMIDGISQWHESRLMDNGVDNIQNLASADILSLLVNTTFSAQQVIDWVDQAILYLYLDPHTIENFRRVAAVRTTTDFRDIWEDQDAEGKEKLASKLQTTVEMLDALRKSVDLGPNAHFIIPYWESASLLAESVREKEFENLLTKLTRKDQDPAELEYVYNKAYSVFNSIKDHFDASKFVSEEALIGLGNLHRSNRRYDDAIEAYREAIQRYPKSALARNELAWLYINDMQESVYYSEALKLAKEAVSISPQAAFLDTLAACHIKLGDLDEAEALLKEAKSKPDVPEFGMRHIEKHLEEVQASRQLNKTG